MRSPTHDGAAPLDRHQGPGRLVGIQYLRGIAAALVVMNHTASMSSFDYYFGRSPAAIFDYGFVGVDLFFVISGVIMVYIALRPGDAAARVSFPVFMARRFFRVVPVMWVCIAGYLALRTVGRGVPDDLAPYLRAFALWPVGDVKPEVIWTLRHEFLFYLVFGTSMLIGRQRPYLLVAWILSPLALLAALRPEMWPADLAGFLFNPANLEFGAGVAVGWIFLKRSERPLFALPFAFPVLVAMSAGLLAATWLLGLRLEHVPSNLVMGGLSAVIVACSLGSRRDGSPLGRLGEAVGDASFSIYLVHPGMVSAMLGIWSRLQPEAPMALVLPVITGASIAGGYVVYRLVERPLVRTLERRFTRRDLTVATEPAVVPA